MRRSRLPEPAVFGFLLPNFLGFVAFTFFPILLCFYMAFTNWSLKPAVPLTWVGLRNFGDLLGVRALTAREGPLWLYVASAAAMVAGLVGSLWANVANWRGARLGGAILAATGLAALTLAIAVGGPQGTGIAAAVVLICGLAAMRREEGTWRPGLGAVMGLLVAAGALGLWRLHADMWTLYEARDFRFWNYFYNTLYLMLGIPLSIAGSLGLALLLNERLPTGGRGRRTAAALLCAGCGALTMLVLWWANPLGIEGAWRRDAGLLGGVLWGMLALGIAFNVVAFRTLYYLPTFTAGVALMILWKALYNPETGPINVSLAAVFEWLGIERKPPQWLGSVAWAKPALILMGVWTAIGGTNMLLYLAGLSNIPRDLLDAAAVDGAGRWARFRHVIWPQLAPTTFFISVMSIIGGLQAGFQQARVMTQGGPAGSTTTLSYYIYLRLFEDLNLGYAAAISWVLFAIIFVATLINWKFGKGLEVEL